MFRDGIGILSFIILWRVTADGEGARGSASLLLHQRHDCGGINSAGEKCTHRHVCEHLLAHRIAQQMLKSVRRFDFVAGKWFGCTLLCHTLSGPVTLWLRPAVRRA